MIDEIYDDYEKRLSNSNEFLKMRGLDENINELPLGVNLDIENILTPLDLFNSDDDEIAKKIKEAYIEIFKEGIYMGIGFGKIIKFNYAKASPENYIECLEEDYKHYILYDFKVAVIEMAIPPISVKKFTMEENPREIEYENKKFSDIRPLFCTNIETMWEDKFDIEANPEAKEMESHIRQREIMSFLENEELKECVDELKKGIRKVLFEKFFKALDIDLEKAESLCENHVKFDEETAEDLFVSPVFRNLEGEFKAKELLDKYLIYVFKQGKVIGLLNGTKLVLEDIQNKRLDYSDMKAMSSKESFDYIKEGL